MSNQRRIIKLYAKLHEIEKERVLFRTYGSTKEGWSARVFDERYYDVPNMPGITSFGRTREEAKKYLEDKIEDLVIKKTNGLLEALGMTERIAR
jgi:predicted RNase H-like HicB family nuclease